MATSNKLQKITPQTRLALNDENKIPIIGIGTWEAKGNDVENAVFHALEVGYRHIDTATIYGNEEQVGAAIKRAMSELRIPREEIFVTTKLWNVHHENVERAFSKSLTALNLDYIDLYLMHFPTRQRLTSWRAMEKIKESGHAKSIGVSNFTIRHLHELLAGCTIRPAVNQVEMTPFLYQRDLIDYCEKNKILVCAYSPLLRGQRLDDPTLVRIASAHHKSVPQILIRWSIQHGLVPLPKSITPSRIDENIAIFDFELSKEDMLALDNLNCDLRLCWDPSEAP